MNSLFGKQLDAQGQKTWMSVFANGKTLFRSDSLDESIAANAAERLKPGGTMVLVMAGPSPQTIEQGNKARADHYAKTHAAFNLPLHCNCEATEHVTLPGSLYEKQGAGWPIDVIIAKRRSDTIVPPRRPPTPPFRRS